MKKGNKVKMSKLNTDQRLDDKKIYAVLEASMGCIKIKISEEESEWYSEDDFVLCLGDD